MRGSLDTPRALQLLQSPPDAGRDGIGVSSPGFSRLSADVLRGALIADLSGLASRCDHSGEVEAALRFAFGLLCAPLAASRPPAALFISTSGGRPHALDPGFSGEVFGGRAFTSTFRGLVTILVPRCFELDEHAIRVRLATWRRHLLEICAQDSGDDDFAALGRGLDRFFNEGEVRWRPSAATSLRVVDLKPLLVFAYVRAEPGSQAQRQCRRALRDLYGEEIAAPLSIPPSVAEAFRARMVSLLVGELDALPAEYNLLETLADRAQGRPAHEPLIEYVVAQRAPFDAGDLHLFDTSGDRGIPLPEAFQETLDGLEDSLDTILGEAMRQRLYKAWLGAVERD